MWDLLCPLEMVMAWLLLTAFPAGTGSILRARNIDDCGVHELQEFSDSLDGISLVVAVGAAVAIFDVAADAVGLNAFRPQESAVRCSVQHARNGGHAGKDLRLRSLERAERLRIQG